MTNDFRLQKINEINTQLKSDIQHRKKVSEKYFRGGNVCELIDGVLILSSVGLGLSGVGLLSTIIAAPVVIGMEVVAGVMGISGVIFKVISRKLKKKGSKHDHLRVLGESKLNSISDYTSKALSDGEISPEEFSHILAEFKKYNDMVGDIKSKSIWFISKIH